MRDKDKMKMQVGARSKVGVRNRDRDFPAEVSKREIKDERRGLERFTRGREREVETWGD